MLHVPTPVCTPTRGLRPVRTALMVVLLSHEATSPAAAQGSAGADTSGVHVRVTPASLEGEVGEEVTFTAVAVDASGRTVAEGAQAWFAAPTDVAGSSMVNTDPAPSVLSAVTSPCIARARSRLMARPRPTPRDRAPLGASS